MGYFKRWKIIIGGGVYLLKISRLQSPERSNGGQANLKPTQTTILSPIPSIDPTANWKTYTNEKYRYSLKYPLDIFVRQICEGEELLLSKRDPTDKAEYHDAGGTCGRGARYLIEIITVTEPVIDEPKSNDDYTVTKTEFNIGDLKAIKYTAESSLQPDNPGPKWYTEVFIEHNNQIHRIYLGKKEFLEIFDQILQTFQFTN